jgi:formylglycine-generating enzyme required for sulfatase activity
MRFSDNGSTWTAWETPTATRPHTLPAGLGYHTVRVQYLDGANNYSLVCNDYIKLVEPAPGSTQTVLLPGDVPLVMVWIPSGSFMMGRYPGELLSSTSEDPQHLVTLTGFWMGKYELTKRQWIAVMGTTPWFGKNYTISDLDSPAVWVSWDDAQAFMVVLNALTGKTFHLPSESQWEYACRAGTATLFYWSDNGSTDLVSEYAWWTGNCLLQTSWYAHVVGLKLPNSLGLYDMSGNVWECCEDYYHDSYVNAPTDGSAWVVSPIYSKARIGRGGSYNVRGSSFSCIRSAARNTGGGTGPDYGFRVARS